MRPDSCAHLNPSFSAGAHSLAGLPPRVNRREIALRGRAEQDSGAYGPLSSAGRSTWRLKYQEAPPTWRQKPPANSRPAAIGCRELRAASPRALNQSRDAAAQCKLARSASRQPLANGRYTQAGRAKSDQLAQKRFPQSMQSFSPSSGLARNTSFWARATVWLALNASVGARSQWLDFIIVKTN